MNYQKKSISKNFAVFEKEYGKIPSLCLCNAGIKTLAQAKAYLCDTNYIPSSLLPDIDKAENIIQSAINRSEKLCIFGDYDADGVTSSAILKLTLDALGADSFVRLPDRIEGYGISLKAVEECIQKGAKLIITVDNGIKAIEEIAYAKSKGISVVVLDHHIPGDEIPDADAIIDLHWKNGKYPYTHLTGSGLAFKVALYLTRNIEFDATKLVDLAAIGTIADVEELLGENRVIVKNAIKLMRSKEYSRYGVKALYGRDLDYIRAEDIAFSIGPAVNACGRLQERGAEKPLNLLLCKEEELAKTLADEIISVNEERKTMQKRCYNKIKSQAEKYFSDGDGVLVVLSDDAPTGIVGLLAGNLKEEFGVPAIVFGKTINAEGEEIYTGSARSIEECNIHDALLKASDTLIRFGGHALAAGMSVKPENLDIFRETINSLVSISDEIINKPYIYDLELDEKEITDELLSDLDTCEPFGQGNPKPRFKVRARTELVKNGLYQALGADKQHLKLRCESFDILGFNMAEEYRKAKTPKTIEAYGTLSVNHFNGQNYNQLMLDNFVPIEEKKTDLMASLSSMLKF